MCPTSSITGKATGVQEKYRQKRHLDAIGGTSKKCFNHKRTETLPNINNGGFAWTRVPINEPWLFKTTILIRLFGEIA
ncbi:hypothetical protein D3C86_866590 [compost metagenome]